MNHKKIEKVTRKTFDSFVFAASKRFLYNTHTHTHTYTHDVRVCIYIYKVLKQTNI